MSKFSLTRTLLLFAPLILGTVSIHRTWGQDDSGTESDYVYPIAVAVESGDDLDGDVLYVVDLELPGVWKVTSEGKEIYTKGSKRFREPLNAPRCIAVAPGGGILVGDSATRDVYHITGAGAKPKPLTDGRVGVPMTLAVSQDEQTVYVGDAEKMAVMKFPIDGGQPEWVSRVNARGLAFRDETTLVALTPDAASVRAIDTSMEPVARPDKIVNDPTVTTLVNERVFQYPNGLAARDDVLYAADGYGKSVYRLAEDDKPEVWLKGDPLIGPVGIAAGKNAIWVADPQAKKLFALTGKGETATVAQTR